MTDVSTAKARLSSLPETAAVLADRKGLLSLFSRIMEPLKIRSDNAAELSTEMRIRIIEAEEQRATAIKLFAEAEAIRAKVASREALLKLLAERNVDWRVEESDGVLRIVFAKDGNAVE